MKTLIVGIALLFSSSVFAQEWQLIGPPGGRVTSLAINPKQTNIVLGATSDNVLFKTENAGATSKVLFDSGGSLFVGSKVTFNPIDPNVIYAGSFRSINAGDSWVRLNGIGSSLAINSKNPDRIFTSAYGRQVFVSENAGDTWSLLYEFKNALGLIAISTSDTSILYALANDSLYGVYKSTNSGVTWERTNWAINVFTISSIAINPINAATVYAGTTDDGIFKTTDGGVTWNQVLSTEWVHDIAINPNDTTIVYAVTGDYLTPVVGNVFKTTNNGISWSIINNGLPSDYNRFIYHVEINPQNSDEVYIGTYGFGVYKTLNGGTDWQWTNLIKAAVISMSFHPSHAGYIYAGTYDEGIVQTTNGGETWSLLSLDLPTTVQSAFRQICFNTQNNNIAYLTAGPYGLLKSTNAGAAWQQTTLGGSFDTWAWSLAIHPTNPETIYVGQTGWLGRDLFRSTNGGSTWENLQVMNSTGSGEQVLFDSTSPNVIYMCAASIGFFKSTDDGQTWLKMNSGLKVSEEPSVSPVLSVDIDINDRNLLYLAQGAVGTSIGGVLTSTDGGYHWVAIDSTLALMDHALNVKDISHSLNNPGFLYASLQNHGQRNTSSYSPGGIYVTSNNGGSWRRVFNVSSQGIQFDLHNSNQLYVATKAGIFLAKESEILSVEKSKEEYPNDIMLYHNYPNPFNSQTTIRYAVKRSGSITIRLFNILGEEVRKFHLEHDRSGEYEIRWDGKNQKGGEVSSGVYFYRLETPHYTVTKKLILLR
jgi:photosystem II stability/assembly factor-like uncharacterized protein